MTEQRTTYQLVEAVVARLSPEELPFLPDLWSAYVRRPGDVERARERLLGAGILADVAAWAPLVVSFVGGAVLDAVKEEITEGSRGLLGRLTWRKDRKRALEEPLPVFDDEQCRRIAASVQSRAEALGLDERRARLLRDAVVGELRLGDGDVSRDRA
jgi:hypothetical protein